MAKRRFLVHLGLPHAGAGGLADLLAEHAVPLAGAGVRVPARSADEARRAALEMRRLHSTYGLKRKEVEERKRASLRTRLAAALVEG